MFPKTLCIAPGRPRLATALAATAGLATLVLPLAALAHAGADAGGHHGFAGGLAHPFTGLDHLAAMLAVGLWSGLSARRVWVAPFAFAGLLLVGALLAGAGLALPAVEPMIAASLLVLGLLLATRQAMPAGMAALLVGGFALFHGAAHGGELSGGAALAGMVLATALLHAAGLGMGLALHRHGDAASRWLPRVAGLAVAGFGSTLLFA